MHTHMYIYVYLYVCVDCCNVTIKANMRLTKPLGLIHQTWLQLPWQPPDAVSLLKHSHRMQYDNVFTIVRWNFNIFGIGVGQQRGQVCRAKRQHIQVCVNVSRLVQAFSSTASQLTHDINMKLLTRELHLKHLWHTPPIVNELVPGGKLLKKFPPQQDG